MGRASSSKKVARAAKAAGRPGTKKSYLWPASIAVVVVLGIGLIAASAAGRNSGADTGPILGDHWHAAYGIDVCGEWLPPLRDLVPDESGLHTHEDGLVHLHPFKTTYTGEKATINAWGETVGLEVGDGSLTLPDRELTDGDDCGGEPGAVQVKVWDSPSAPEGRLLDGDPGDHAFADGEVVTIAFLPEGDEVEQPPTTPRLQDPNAAEEGRAVVPIEGSGEAPEGSTPTSAPADGTTDTSAAEGGATTDTSAAEGGASSTTAAP
jgi:hypothetical protein